MASSFSTVAYVTVIVGGSTLFAIGPSRGEPPPSPATPDRMIVLGETVLVRDTGRSLTVAGFTLRSTTVDLPDSERMFPAGPGMDVTQQNCTACHSVGMVMNQPNLSKAAWEGEVAKMRTVYKAPIAGEDVPAIVTYLASIKGSP